MLLFDGDTDQLITALLRPGRAPPMPATAWSACGQRAVSVLRVLIPLVRARWPGVQIEIRSDRGCAVPAVYAFCEREHLGYTIGLIPNKRLEALAAPLLAQAKEQRAQTGETVRLVAETTSRIRPTPGTTRVVSSIKPKPWTKAPTPASSGQAPLRRDKPRFVGTSRPAAPEDLYNWYVDRGEPELWIKDFKRACLADRLSDCRFWANQFRLFLHAAAYWLLDTLRAWLTAQGYPPLPLDALRLRLRLRKIGGRVRALVTCVRRHLATSHPSQSLGALLAHSTALRE